MTPRQPTPPIPINAENVNHSGNEQSKSAHYVFDFGADTQYEVSLLNQQQQKVLQEMRTFYWDLTDCANDVIVRFKSTQQRIRFRAGSWGYTPVAAALSDLGFTVTGTAPDVAEFLVLNYDLQSIISEAPVTDIAPGDVEFSTSPVILGRYSAGAGPGQEIPIVAPFQINNVQLSVQAGAQFNIFGRRTAGAGAMEDCTRAQLSLARVDADNAFSAPQRINQNAASPDAFFNANTVLQMEGADGASSYCVMKAYGGQAIFAGVRVNGTPAAPTGVLNTQILFSFRAYGWNSGGAISTFLPPIVYEAIEDFTLTANGSRLVLQSVAAGTTACLTRWYLEGSGGLRSIGATDPGINALAVSNFTKTGVFTVATLPAAATAGAGARANVNNALAPAYLAALAGGGAAFSGALSTGAAWVSS